MCLFIREMRIYILSNASVEKNMLAKLEPYLHSTRKVNYIWSINGLYQVENHKIYKMQIKDVPAKKTLIGAFPATIDESEFIRGEEEAYQVAPRSYIDYTTLKTYRLHPSSSLEWVLEFKNEELHDNYFTLASMEEKKTELQQFLNL